MNSTPVKFIQKLSNFVIKVVILVVILVLSSNQGSAQTIAYSAEDSASWSRPTTSAIINVILEEEKTETLGIRETNSSGQSFMPNNATRHIDILKVYYPAFNDHLSFIYLGDLACVKGDSLQLKVVLHNERDDQGTSAWHDYELSKYLDEDGIFAAKPANKRFHTGVIVKILGVKFGSKD